MIPIFPMFTALSLTLRKEIETITRAHPTHSDFNLAGLWSYDVDHSVSVSVLHDNLLIRSKDYLTRQPFYSVLGSSAMEETMTQVLHHAQIEEKNTELRLVSEHTLDHLTPRHPFRITEDRDNFDYVLSVDNLIGLKGSAFHTKRYEIRRFLRKHGTTVSTKTLDLKDSTVFPKLSALFHVWAKQRSKNPREAETEHTAMRRLAEAARHFELYATAVFVHNTLIAFSIDEIVQDNHGIIHFEKADVTYDGAFEYLKQQSARAFAQNGCTYINYEQDLGIEGLRRAKMSFRPVRFIKKYRIGLLRQTGARFS